MNTYQNEQLDALLMVRRELNAMADREVEGIRAQIADYLMFRTDVADFSATHLAGICTEKCFGSRLSACCAKDGIITFFADVVINALVSDNPTLDRLENAIRRPVYDFKCIFLSESGCLWRVKPIVCEMFLCDEAESRAFSDKPEVRGQWHAFGDMKKRYTWPDRPVLFEHMERIFMSRGGASPLMYIHNSPGLSRIRQRRKP